MSLFDGEPLTEQDLLGHKSPAMGKGSHCLHDASGRPTRRRPYNVDYGLGPEGATCGGCRHLDARKMSKRFFKCRLHPITFGPGTDIGSRDAACTKFEPAPTPAS